MFTCRSDQHGWKSDSWTDEHTWKMQVQEQHSSHVHHQKRNTWQRHSQRQSAACLLQSKQKNHAGTFSWAILCGKKNAKEPVHAIEHNFPPDAVSVIKQFVELCYRIRKGATTRHLYASHSEETSITESWHRALAKINISLRWWKKHKLCHE